MTEYNRMGGFYINYYDRFLVLCNGHTSFEKELFMKQGIANPKYFD